MNAILDAAKFYETRGWVLSQDLEYYLKWGIVLKFPDRFIMGREINLDRGLNEWAEPGTGNAWFVHFASGKNCMRWFLEQAPRRLPYIVWQRSARDEDAGKLPRIRIYKTEALERLLSR